VNERNKPGSILKVPCYQAPKSADDPLIGVAHMIADTIVAIGGPLFWGVLGIGLLTSFFR
jgi:hypothetical protein